jgi:hypothetical protein
MVVVVVMFGEWVRDQARGQIRQLELEILREW